MKSLFRFLFIAFALLSADITGLAPFNALSSYEKSRLKQF